MSNNNGLSNFANKVMHNKIFLIVILILVMLLSIFPVEKYVSNPTSYSNTMSILNTKNENVMKITAGITAFSLGVAFIPAAGDTISNQVANLIKYLVAVIAIIYLEKYLLAVSGYISFKWLIPIACIFMIIYVITKKGVFKNIASKLAIFAMLLVLIVPISVHITNLIENSNKTVQNMIKTTDELKNLNDENVLSEMNLDSITIDNKNVNSEIIENVDTNNNKEDEIKKEEGNKNILEKVGGFLNKGKEVAIGSIDKAKESIGSVVSLAGDKLNEAKEFAVNKLRQLIESVAIMLVTSCVIPILVLLVLISITKSLFGFDFSKYVKDANSVINRK